MFNLVFNKYKKLNESSIDFPRDDLDLNIWKKNGKSYELRYEVKQKILAFLSTYPDIDLIKNAEKINIVGSIGTNQYENDADIDLHIVPHKNTKLWNDENLQKEVKKWSTDKDVRIFNHPLEIYIQIDPEQDIHSLACYNLNDNKWIVGPSLVPKDYNPYDDFKSVFGEIEKFAGEADIDFGELSRDVIDFKTIKSAIERMTGEQKVVLMKKLQQKVSEIEDDIENLYKDRKDWVDLRRNASSEEARKDVENIKKWKNANAVFKFLNRYQYTSVIGELQKLLTDDGRLTNSEIDEIPGILRKKHV